MSELKIYTCNPGCEDKIEKSVQEYLDTHPGSYIQSQSLAQSQYRTSLSVVFDTGVVNLPYIPEQPWSGPFGPIGPVITQDGPSDDPWKGEFIPLGDPPMPTVKSAGEIRYEQLMRQRRNANVGANYGGTH